MRTTVLISAVFFCLGFTACTQAPRDVPPDSERYSVPQKSVFTETPLSPEIQIRSVEKPTAAALDFAAYFANPIRLAGMEEPPENFTGKASALPLSKYPFPEFDSLRTGLPPALAPLAPVAWEPFARYLHAKAGSAADILSEKLRRVESEKWGEPGVFRPFQNVTRLWCVPSGDGLEFWAEVTPAPWTHRAPFFGKLRNIKTPAADRKIFEEYTTRELTADEAMDWARNLASYWYPTLNTDLEPHAPGSEWKGSRPFAIMRGNPLGHPMWVAFDAPAFRRTDAELSAAADNAPSAAIARTADTSSAARLATIAALDGFCPDDDSVEKFRSALEKKLKELPAEQNAWNESGFLWFRRDADYLLAGDIASQDSLHNPLPRLLELKQYLDSLNIQLLIVPVPVKEEIYPDLLIPGTPKGLCVDPRGRDFIRKALYAGLDVLDIYPALIAARNDDAAPMYAYQRYDTHWAKSGLLAAMELLATHVTSYSWYASLPADRSTFEARDTVVYRDGDLVEHLPDGEKGKYAADTLPVLRVYKDGVPYKGKSSSPILLMGDSFTGVFESVDGRSGGPGSLLAFATGLDVEVLTSWGGGPGVRGRMFRAQKSLASKRLVIYMMTMRDLWHSPMEWDGLRSNEN